MITFLMKKVARPILITIIILAALLPWSVFTRADENATEKTYYFLTDHLGSVDVVLDEEGNVVERADYLPYGNDRLRIDNSPGESDNHKFTGKEKDDETGLMFYGARYYDPATGRFVSYDPMLLDEGSKPLASNLQNPQALNPYTYALNNPVKYTDATGEYEEDVHMYLTEFLASNAGFNTADSFSIGLYDQLTDSDSNTTPWDPKNSQYHFPTSEETLNLGKTAVTTLDNKDIGHFLHSVQDTFSHAGFSIWTLGHIPYGFLPDKTYLDSGKANIMSEQSFRYLRLINRLKNGTGDLKLKEYNEKTNEIWLKIRDTVNNFNKLKTLEEKKQVLKNGNEQQKTTDKKSDSQKKKK